MANFTLTDIKSIMNIKNTAVTGSVTIKNIRDSLGGTPKSTPTSTLFNINYVMPWLTTNSNVNTLVESGVTAAQLKALLGFKEGVSNNTDNPLTVADVKSALGINASFTPPASASSIDATMLREYLNLVDTTTSVSADTLTDASLKKYLGMSDFQASSGGTLTSGDLTTYFSTSEVSPLLGRNNAFDTSTFTTIIDAMNAEWKARTGKNEDCTFKSSMLDGAIGYAFKSAASYVLQSGAPVTLGNGVTMDPYAFGNTYAQTAEAHIQRWKEFLDRVATTGLIQTYAISSTELTAVITLVVTNVNSEWDNMVANLKDTGKCPNQMELFNAAYGYVLRTIVGKITTAANLGPEEAARVSALSAAAEAAINRWQTYLQKYALSRALFKIEDKVFTKAVDGMNMDWQQAVSGFEITYPTFCPFHAMALDGAAAHALRAVSNTISKAGSIGPEEQARLGVYTALAEAAFARWTAFLSRYATQRIWFSENVDYDALITSALDAVNADWQQFTSLNTNCPFKSAALDAVLARVYTSLISSLTRAGGLSNEDTARISTLAQLSDAMQTRWLAFLSKNGTSAAYQALGDDYGDDEPGAVDKYQVALDACVNEWNNTPKLSSKQYTADTFPYPAALIEGASGILLKELAVRYSKIGKQGTSTEDNAKIAIYNALAEASTNRWRIFIEKMSFKSLTQDVYSLSDVVAATADAINEWNNYQPCTRPVYAVGDSVSFPYAAQLLDGVIGRCMKMSALKLLGAGGLDAGEQGRATAQLQVAENYLKKWSEFIHSMTTYFMGKEWSDEYLAICADLAVADWNTYQPMVRTPITRTGTTSSFTITDMPYRDAFISAVSGYARSTAAADLLRISKLTPEDSARLQQLETLGEKELETWKKFVYKMTVYGTQELTDTLLARSADLAVEEWNNTPPVVRGEYDWDTGTNSTDFPYIQNLVTAIRGYAYRAISENMLMLPDISSEEMAKVNTLSQMSARLLDEWRTFINRATIKANMEACVGTTRNRYFN